MNLRRSPMPRSTKALQRSPMVKRTPKRRAGHNKAMLAACRGQECFLAIPGVCRGRTETVVPCHSNQSKHGKGMGLKARDEFTVPGCQDCNTWLDQGPADRHTKAAHFDWALTRWEPVRDAACNSDRRATSLGNTARIGVSK